MQNQTNARSIAYGIIVIGLILAFVSAVVPFYGTGYELMLSVLLSGLIPYLIYGIAIPFLNGGLLILPGLVLVAIHAWLVVSERFLKNADYSDGMIYYLPVVLAILLLPLILRALREPWGAEPGNPSNEHSETTQ